MSRIGSLKMSIAWDHWMCSWTGNGKHTSWESPAKTKAVCLKGEGGWTSTIIWINHSTLQPPISSYRYFLSGSLKGRHSTNTTSISTNLYFEIQYVPKNNKQLDNVPLCETQMFTTEKYSPLKNIHPRKYSSLRMIHSWKYSPLKNIHSWKIFTLEKYSPLKSIKSQKYSPL